MAKAPVERFPQSLLTCGCGRNGYALVLCPEHAPIPYVVTDRGRREVRRMRQWDAVFETLEATRESNPRRKAALRAWVTRRNRRVPA